MFYLAIDDAPPDPQDVARHFVNYEVIRKGNPALAARYRTRYNEEITVARRLLGLLPVVEDVSRTEMEQAGRPKATPEPTEQRRTDGGLEHCYTCNALVVQAIVYDHRGFVHQCPMCQAPFGTTEIAA